MIHHLLLAARARRWRKQLRVLDSVLLAYEIGMCLINLLGAPDVVRAWLAHIRTAVHAGGSAAYTALAAGGLTYAA